MKPYLANIDMIDELEEFSAILNTHDESPDVNADEFVKDCAVAAALAFCNVKVEEKHRIGFPEQEYQSQLRRIHDKLEQYYSGDSYSVVRAAVDAFIAEIASRLIMCIDDQSQTPLFEKINDDLSIVFKVMGGNDENELSSRVSAGT